MSGVEAIAAEVERSIAAGATPGAAIAVGRGSQLVFEACYGRLWPEGPAVTPTSLYDLSSLTKPLATLACLLRLIAGRKLSFSTPVCDVLGEFARDTSDPRRSRVTILQLAAHASGLPARGRYFETLSEEARRSGADVLDAARATDRVVALACGEPLVGDPGSAVLYSDVGYILLGAVLARISGNELSDTVVREVLAALSLRDTGFIRVDTGQMRGRSLDLSRVAPTDICPWRKQLVHGVVQDENAYAMGGVAGHAGLFGTARDVHALTVAYVDACFGKTSILDPALVRQCWAGAGCVVPGSTWAVGWDTPTSGVSSAGRRVSMRAFGHLGFTGTSIWVDLERRAHVALLTNRVHPSKEHPGIREMRPRVHDAIFKMLDEG